MLLVKTYLAPSPIEGLGVFAAEFVRAGALIWALNPKFDVFIAASEVAQLPPHMRDYVARYGYPHLEMPGVLILDSDDGKYMNHSDAPNTDFRVFDRAYAIRDIGSGEEITCDYAEFDPSFRGFVAAASVARPRLGRNGRGNGRRHHAAAAHSSIRKSGPRLSPG